MMEFRAVLFAAVLMWCAALATSQPVSCIEDGECHEGYFCETSVYQCRECLSCQDLKREQLRSPQTCIKSIRECGPCLKGLVEDRQGDLNCVPPSDRMSASDGNITTWVIAGVTIALIFIVALAVIFIRYIYKNNFIKFSVDTNIDATLPSHVVATAPESPPPYSPAHQSKETPQLDTGTEETSQPLIKPYQPPYPAYESQDYQNVSVFNPPSYVRLNKDLPKVYNDMNDNYSPAAADDEDTTPSAWVPGHSRTDAAADSASNSGAIAATSTAVVAAQPQRESNKRGGNDFSTALAIARNTDLIQPPSVTLQLQTRDRSEEATGGDNGDAYTHHNPNGASARNTRYGINHFNVMNVNQVINVIEPPSPL